MNAGLRFQTANGGVPARCQAETVFIAGQCWPEQPNVTDFQNLTPRFSAVYDMFGNGMTAIKFSANRYVFGLGTSVSARLDPIRLASDTRSVERLEQGQVSTVERAGTIQRLQSGHDQQVCDRISNASIQRSFRFRSNISFRGPRRVCRLLSSRD